jgi:hypothetical protein
LWLEGPERIPRMENWGSMIDSWAIQLLVENSQKVLAMRENPKAIQMGRPRRVMASRMTSRERMRSKRLPRSLQALLVRDHSALISRRESSNSSSSWQI